MSLLQPLQQPRQAGYADAEKGYEAALAHLVTEKLELETLTVGRHAHQQSVEKLVELVVRQLCC